LLVTGGYICFVIACVFTIDEQSSPKERGFTFFLPVLIATVAFIQIAYKKGEKPQWQWGIKQNKKK